MCAPAVMAAVTVASAGASIYSQHKQASFDAKVARNNAMLAAEQAEATRQVGELQASRIEAQGRRVAGAATAAVAASGIDTTVGSGAGAIATSHMVSAADAAAARSNAARAAWGYQQEAQDYTAQARQRKTAGILGGVSTGLSAVGGILGGYARS